MRLKALRVVNFKAIRCVELSDLDNFVLIAGPNGSGKSCILDAIRILKTYYGEYVRNEIDQLFSEFQLDLNNPKKLAPLFRDTNEDLEIAAEFTLSEDERTYLRENAERLLADHFWTQKIGRQIGDNTPLHQQILLFAAQNPEMAREVAELTEANIQGYNRAMDVESFRPSIRIKFGQLPEIQNHLFSTIFRTFAPDKLGIIDYHSAFRNYGREVVGGVSVDLLNRPAPRADLALYNTNAKYSGIKAEIVGAYVRDLVRSDAGLPSVSDDADLSGSLTQLFEWFFPDKKFSGLRINADGTPEFPVTVGDGLTHDLNELSAGEKEVLYGYLRLRSATPRNSVILIDEPELHLNPGLVWRLPQFYRTHIGKARNNQMILVTHSDALLRPVVGSEEYQIWHLSPASVADDNQVELVTGEDELDAAILDLIGDVASYKPTGKFVLLEGGDEHGANSSGFDRKVITALFPRFAQRVNLVSSRDKSRVRRLLEVLGDPEFEKKVRARFYAIVDLDAYDEQQPKILHGNFFRWDVYHIENYLMDAAAISGAIYDLTLEEVPVEKVAVDLKRAATAMLDTIALRIVKGDFDRRLRSRIKLGGSVRSPKGDQVLRDTVSSTKKNLRQELNRMSDRAITTAVDKARQQTTTALEDGTWVRNFPARDVLNEYVSITSKGKFKYENLISAVVSRMASNSIQPQGMRNILEQIDPESFADDPIQESVQ